jgi:hypothetical protein
MVQCLPSVSNTWIQTFSGRKFDFVREYWEHDDIDIVDIAVALSRVPRYCGHTRVASCVAQHSVHVSEEVEWLGGSQRDQLIGLLHDATEAYMADIPSPLKRLIPEYQKIESSLWARVSHKFIGEVVELPAIVKKADEALLVAEAWDTFEYPPLDSWTDSRCPRSEITIVPWHQEYAVFKFLERFNELAGNSPGRVARTNGQLHQGDDTALGSKG